MATKHFYNNTTFETRGYEDDIDASKYITLSEWTEYALGQEPQVLIDALYIAPSIPEVVTMRQARLALLQSNLLTTVTDAIVNGTDEAMKIEWEYATEVRRDWPSLITLATSLGLTSQQLDDLFTLAGTL